MSNYSMIEKKWQEYWENEGVFHSSNGGDNEKFYYLVEFPYPSGAGLHVGHVRSYTALDCMARKKRMQGFNVLFPIGWDAFGAPAEQFAIKNKIHPKDAVNRNIETFKSQIQKLGISFDWKREIATTDPEYYKWTQWQFLQFFKHGMAYKDRKNINWCPNCKMGLSNEDSSGGVCERCGSPVEQKEKEQWMLRMSDYAQDLIDGLDDTNFQERIKTAQINWIGKSTGAEVKFKVEGLDEEIIVYTTRPDTLYGATFMVLAPEHPIIDKNKDIIKNMDEIESYRNSTKMKTEFERTQVNKDKTGVKIDGLVGINPINDKKLPVYISDYVMMNYGTGAIMAVPAHDERDYEFAHKFGIDIVEVIKGGDISVEAYTGDGEMINSGILNGYTNKKDSIQAMIKYLEENDLGKARVNYKLQDWIFSRQRFWGEPIPIVCCDSCGYVPVPESELPVVLPDVVNYEPTDDGESPLAAIDEWVNTTCPKCGMPAKRETDTMPNWAGSSWYWLRYMDANNKNEFASMDALKYWGKLDFYNGGMEHATRHLLYARFWNQFLYNIGLVPNKEPFNVRVSHGMILGEGGVKMSKSIGNVINPDDMVEIYGADSLRCYEMFIGDYEKEVAWSEQGLNGCKRFLDRVVRIGEKVVDGENYSLEKLTHQTIKKVTEDIDNMKFNTAVSSLMILLNEFEKLDSITKADYRVFLLLLNPVAPHITEEMNEKYNLGEVICKSNWPSYDAAKTVDLERDIAVQVNGKVRATIRINVDDSDDVIKEKAMKEENVIKHLDGKEIVKVIVIKGKIINIVVK